MDADTILCSDFVSANLPLFYSNHIEKLGGVQAHVHARRTNNLFTRLMAPRVELFSFLYIRNS
ncbi:hypothetical protein FACS189459_5550 [Bacilli bacterium]|nr:hypothetical protein FACS189459_5550 [Bacilli bacterium]